MQDIFIGKYCLPMLICSYHKVVTIGVGTNADETEISAIASGPSQIIHVRGFRGLTAMLSNLTYTVCQSK